MARFTPSVIGTLSITAFGVVLATQAAHADLTASDVWADWKSYLSSSGYSVSATENLSGDTLQVDDVTLKLVLPEGEGDISGNIGDLTFKENGDGTVSVSFPEKTSMTLDVVAAEQEAFQMAFDYLTKDFVMTVSGEPADLVYNYSASEVAIQLKDLVAEGQPIDIGAIEMSVADLTGFTTAKLGEMRSTEQTLKTGAISYTIDMKDPENSDGTIFLNGTFAGMDMKADSVLPGAFDMENFAATLSNGFDVDAVMTFSTGATKMKFSEDGQTVDGESSSESSEVRVAMGKDGLTYDVGAEGMKMFMSGGDLPLPIELAMAKAGFNLTMPISKAEEEQDFALGVTMGDFTISDVLWSIFDPSQQLPRDPATIAFDITGKAKLFFDLMDPEQMASVETGGETPGELNSLDLNALTLRVAGAELTGNGAFTFDNTDLQTFDGLPAPDGAVDLSLTGGNGLLDKLIGMGLVPEDQAMGVRMMMGLFAVPGDGEDSLKSKIEVKSDGQVLANGQRLR